MKKRSTLFGLARIIIFVLTIVYGCPLTAQETTLKADFTTDVVSGRPQLVVHFTDKSNGNPIKWSWDFGDGGTSTEQNPVHTYYSCGVYSVSLTVTNDSMTYGVKMDSLICVKPEAAANTIYSTTTGGKWSSSSTWVGGVTPSVSDDVVINGDVILNYSHNFECNNLIISAGKELSSVSFNGDYTHLTVHGDLCNKGTIGDTKSFSMVVEKKLINDGSIGANTNLSNSDYLSIEVQGELINNGNIDDSNEGDLKIHAKANILNRGTWQCGELHFEGADAQTISGDSIYSVGYFSVENNQKIIAGSNLNFVDSYLRFNGSEFEIPAEISVSFTKVKDVSNYLSKAAIKGGGTIVLNGGFYIGYNSSLEDITLSGEVEVIGTLNIKENVVFSGQMQNVKGKYPDVYFLEDFENDGKIIDNSESGRLYLHINKSFVNNGTWRVFRTYIEGVTDQTITDKGGLAVNEFILKSNVKDASTYQWYKGNDAIDGATNYQYYVKTDEEYAGIYYCHTDKGDSRKITLKKVNATLSAAFTSDVTSGRVPLTVKFTDQSTGNPTSWSWDFGDGSSSMEQNPTHKYESAGDYTVALTVSDGASSDTVTKASYITVNSSAAGDLLKEHFDGETFPPAGWTQKITQTDYTWQKGNPKDNSFTNIDPTNVYSALSPYVNKDQDEWLKSPLIDLPAGDITYEFYAGYSTNWLTNATLKLNISTDGGSTWTKIWEAENDGKDWSWRKVSGNLNAYAGKTVMLGWQYAGNDGDLVAIDNVEIKQGITGINDHQAAIDRILLQNYPNPFTGQTHISFSLEKKSNVRLVIYNSLGQKIAEPVSGTLNAGKHKVTFDGSSLHSGIYFYRLVVDGLSTTKRMVIQK